MRHTLLTLAVFLTGMVITHAQVLFREDFEGGILPPDWTMQTNASDGGWIIGTPAALSSQYWPITTNGSGRIVATNDDGCNCDKSQDRIITPPLDFTGLTGVALHVDVFFGKGTYESFTEEAAIEISFDGATWTMLEELHGHAGWDTHYLDLSAYAGEDSVYISFTYNDGGGWLFGLAIDNVTVEIPPAIDAGLVALDYFPYGEENSNIVIRGTGFNLGLTPITSLEFGYTINGGNAIPATLEGLNILPFEYFEFSHPTEWIPLISGIYNINVEITSVNSAADENIDNNSQTFEIQIYPHIVSPNRIDEFLLADPVSTTIAGAGDDLNKPTDLDFFPILGKNELWVVNERVESSGGSTLTIYDAGTPDQNFLHREDGNAWHFMSLPSGIAFSDNFNFATSTGVKDANHSGGIFTGPALWTSDPAIYAQPSGGNGSHLDMLHGSPYCMGIASESANAFWVFDGWDETIVRYDFQNDHGPGNDDHADGIVRRYAEISVKRDGNIPNHLVLDKTTGWLYAVDNGNNRVIRLDIHSGEVVKALPLINEPLAEHSEMGNVTWEIIIDSLDRPCGIELIGNRLLVGEYQTGEIIVYDLENNLAELGRISTGQAGLTGIKIGPDGSIWYTNRLQNTLIRLEPGEVTATEEERVIAQIRVWPNPSLGTILIELPDDLVNSRNEVRLSDMTGKTIRQWADVSGRQQLNFGDLTDGIYALTVFNNTSFHTTKILLRKDSN